MVVRTVLGYIFVLFLRQIMKPILVQTLTLLNIPASPPTRKMPDKLAKRGRAGAVVFETKAQNILGQAIVKAGVYASLAWSITFGVPVSFHYLGLLDGR